MNYGHGALIWTLLGFILTFGPWIVSLVVGTIYQRSKKNELLVREKATGQDPLTNLRQAPQGKQITKAQLVWVSVVISPSWFQKMIGGIHSIFGGRINMYLNIIDWGRREAKQQMREKIHEEGWDSVINLRFETSTITNSKGKQKGACAEILVYGTALKY